MNVMREKDRQMIEKDCDDCHERERLWWLSWERKIGTGQMRERLQEVSVMGRLLSTQPIHCTPKPLCIVSRYILQCIAFWGIMIHSQALNSVPKRPDGSQRLSLWLWYRLGSKQPVIIAILQHYQYHPHHCHHCDHRRRIAVSKPINQLADVA